MKSDQSPGTFRYVVGFLVVGICWGFTTPFIRRAALNKQSSSKKLDAPNASWFIHRMALDVWNNVLDLVSRPAYTIPLLVNLAGSALFFLIVGQAELSLTVPITNSLAFLFTVLGEWMADGKSISRDTWIGMALVLSGIAVCVHAKTQVT